METFCKLTYACGSDYNAINIQVPIVISHFLISRAKHVVVGIGEPHRLICDIIIAGNWNRLKRQSQPLTNLKFVTGTIDEPCELDVFPTRLMLMY